LDKDLVNGLKIKKEIETFFGSLFLQPTLTIYEIFKSFLDVGQCFTLKALNEKGPNRSSSPLYRNQLFNMKISTNLQYDYSSVGVFP